MIHSSILIRINFKEEVGGMGGTDNESDLSKLNE